MNNGSIKKQLTKQKGFIPYITYGDPSPEWTVDLCIAAAKAGATICEIGIPFSDPIADGPVIQESHRRALESGHDVSLQAALTMAETCHHQIDIPIIFMASTNLVYQMGIDLFFEHAKAAHLGGIILPDCSIETAGPYIAASKKSGVPIIFLVSPLCRDDRLKKIVDAADGFIYLISSTGITGERQSFSNQLETVTKKIKSIKDIPVVVGFGISQPAHMQTVNAFADGVIVGSHLVKLIEQQGPSKKQALTAFSDRITQFVKK